MGYTVHGILQARMLKWVAVPFSWGSLQPGDRTHLPHCRWTLYQLSHQGSPGILGWVAYPFSRGSSQPSNRTGISCIAGGFFTSWATRESPHMCVYICVHMHMHTQFNLVYSPRSPCYLLDHILTISSCPNQQKPPSDFVIIISRLFTIFLLLM